MGGVPESVLVDSPPLLDERTVRGENDPTPVALDEDVGVANPSVHRLPFLVAPTEAVNAGDKRRIALNPHIHV